jgi:homogentisate phytyltransferase/homogentisate geranylgeranyltransferase
MHILGFFYTVFLGGVLIIKVFSKERLSKIANLIGWGFIILLIPPIVDRFIFGRVTPYSYVPLEEFIGALTTFGLSLYPKIGGLGLLLELLALTTLSSIYVFVKTKSITRTLLNFVVFYLFISFVGTPTLNPIFHVMVKARYYADLSIPLVFLYNLILSLIFLFILLKLSKRGLFSSFIKSSRPLTSVHALLMVGIGVLVAGHLNIGLAPPFAGNIGTFGTSLFLIVFLWQYAVMLNHIYDVEIDRMGNKGRVLPRGMLTISQVKRIAIIYALVSIGLASLLSHFAILITLICLLLGVMYSVPPVRIRNSAFATTIIGLGSSLAFFIGYFTPSYERVLISRRYEFSSVVPELSTEAISIAFLIFIVLSIGSLIKDFKDYEGDKKSGVRNIFTIYGKEKGVNITSMLLPVSFFAPLTLFHTSYDFMVFIPLGLAAMVSFKKLQNVHLVFSFYFLVLFYCLLRWFNIV